MGTSTLRRVGTAITTITALLAVVGLNTGLIASPAAHADTSEGGALYVTMDFDQSSCGNAGVFNCYEFRLRVDPAGWYKNRDILYDWTYTRDGVEKGYDSDDCYYTDGSTCTRWSKTWSYGPVPMVKEPEKICIHIKARQILAPQQVALTKKVACRWTAGGGVDPARPITIKFE